MPAVLGPGSPVPPAAPRRLRRVGLAGVLVLCLLSASLGAGAAVLATSSTPAGPTAAAAQAINAPTAQPAALSTVVAQTDNVTQIAKDVGPAVVAIVSNAVVDNAFGSFQTQGAGSGVIVDPSGLILTNRHVVGDATSVKVYLADGRSFDGTVVGTDTLTDLALLTINAQNLPSAKLGDSATVQVGQPAVAIGNPEGDLPGSVTAGIISALERQITVGDSSGMQAPENLRHLIQHDAAINPGNSGGPLIAADGEVIGINTALAGGAQGIGFAIPINLAKPIVNEVLAGQPIERPYIGIYYTEVNAQVAQDQNLPVASGVIVQGDASVGQPGVIAGGPAAKAGLQDGDIVTAIDGHPVDATHQLDVSLLEHQPGDTVTLTVLRGNKTLQLDVTLGVRPANSVG